ncbi:MAG TPA: carboxypeptidase regulatory-like domain-containing protein [Thermoanaerobaculia bacterium]|nr:carboxypeptidase regulatory-like domain-containing protein [Thermoanaerobaculia bacterium]
MHYIHPRRLLTVALIATAAFATVPSHAQGRRRAAAHPTALNKLTSPKISGTVLDDVTGQPVVFVRVRVGDRTDTTDSAGKYQVKNVSSFGGSIIVEAGRTGYTTKTVQLTTGGERVVDIRLQPLPTVRVKKTDNSIMELDADSIEFGYPVVFSGYNTAAFEEFCKPNGTAVTINRSEIRRVNGAATKAVQAACCGTKEVEKINVELKTGEVTDLYFADTCSGAQSIDLIGRDHQSGKLVYTAFTSISEVVFP